jgi:hypothetical protein
MIGRGRVGETLVLGVLVLLAASLLPARAQEASPELAMLHERGLQLYKAGKFAEAVPIAEQWPGP